MDENTLQIYLENYLVMLKKNTNPNSIPTMFLGLQHFFTMNRIQIDWEIIKKMYPPKIPNTGYASWSKSDIRSVIQATNNVRDEALIRFLASTGVRIGAFDHDLTLQYTIMMPEQWLAVKIYPNTTHEYWVFLAPLANRTLQNYLATRAQDGERFMADTPLFRNHYTKTTVSTVKQLRWSGARTAIYRVVQRSKTHRIKSGQRYNIQIDHGFRKYFNTTLKINNSVNSNIAEKLMGHKNGLDGVYLTPTLRQCFDEIRKAVHDLDL